LAIDAPKSASAAGGNGADAERGLDLLLNKAYVAPNFDQETFDAAWENWEEPLRSWAAAATPQERRRMAFRRYGLNERPGDARGRPLQYVVDDAGNWTINCLACHQGAVGGQVIPGVANNRFALETLTSDIRATKLRLRKALTDMDLGFLAMPLGTSNGTTNAVMFGVALMQFRDADMNMRFDRPREKLTHHDHDAPAWWNTSRKERLYCDDFAPRGHRAMMQFIETTANGPEKFREWEDDFRHVQAYVESIESPKWPWAIDRELAAAGRRAFAKACAECHGEYSDDGALLAYPERIVPIEEVATDPVRLGALTVTHRRNYGLNWINEYGRAGKVIDDPGGYVAPPLSGVWATAPYFHNGSAPTLWHVLHPGQRPKVWTRRDNQNDPAALDRTKDELLALDFDRDRVGLAVQELSDMPASVTISADRRRYFDTRRSGKSAAGHEFPNLLSDQERRAVLEYLKTL